MAQPDVVADCALFLDLDGTLIDIAPMPDGVTIPAGLVPLLETLTGQLRGALAIITGRAIADVDRFIAPLRPVAAGIHGAELRTEAGGMVELKADPINPGVVTAVRALVAEEPGVIIELKRASIAVHHRLAPTAGARIEAALQRILDSGPDHLILCRGRKVLEIVPRHVSKGTALEALLALPSFAGRKPVMIGDDLSDQTAFEAAMRLGGRSFSVAGEQFDPAHADFASPAEVRDWLAAFSRSLAT